MDNSTKMKIVLLIALPLAIFIFVRFCLFGYSKKKKFAKKAYERGHYKRAYRVDSKINTGDYSSGSAYQNDTTKARYEYTVNGKKYHKSFYFNAKSGISSGVPQFVTVYYDENHPEKRVFDVEIRSGTRPLGCFLTILVPVIFILIMYNLWIKF